MFMFRFRVWLAAWVKLSVEASGMRISLVAFW